MQRPIQPAELLRLAAELAGEGGGRGKPQTIKLRRSISSSYYALFHELTFRAALRATGAEASDWSPREAGVARWIAHNDLKDLSRAAMGEAKPALGAALRPLDPKVIDLASSFVSLQDARHEADYNDYFDVSKASALLYQRTAVSAVNLSRTLYRAQDASYLRFLALAIGAVKVAKDR